MLLLLRWLRFVNIKFHFMIENTIYLTYIIDTNILYKCIIYYILIYNRLLYILIYIENTINTAPLWCALHILCYRTQHSALPSGGPHTTWKYHILTISLKKNGNRFFCAWQIFFHPETGFLCNFGERWQYVMFKLQDGVKNPFFPKVFLNI